MSEEKIEPALQITLAGLEFSPEITKELQSNILNSVRNDIKAALGKSKGPGWSVKGTVKAGGGTFSLSASSKEKPVKKPLFEEALPLHDTPAQEKATVHKE